ncbi:MAG: PqqD family protein [Acidobacteriota bacterium]|nr:MAG: PqqD family protein [Acidobacteriota bacterium]
MHPVHRQNDLVVQEVDRELLVYDLNSHRAISLNETAAAVWSLCDGTRSVEDLTESLSERFRETVPVESVLLALEDLAGVGLLESVGNVRFLGSMSRREAIRKIGIASMVAIPIVSSIIAPPAAAAQSTCVPAPGGCTCNQLSIGRVGQQCTPFSFAQCTNSLCRCVWANNGFSFAGNCVP